MKLKFKILLLITAIFAGQYKIFSSEEFVNNVKSTVVFIKCAITQKAREFYKNGSCSCILAAQYIACLTYLNKIAIETRNPDAMFSVTILNLASLGIAGIKLM